MVELSFRAIVTLTRNFNYLSRTDAAQRADEAVEELNGRFQEHGVGYQFAGDEIIRVDSHFIHSEVVKPALRLLNQAHYQGVQQEFLNAHEHYRRGNQAGALNECLKSFESAMKAVCDKRGWSYNHRATAREPIQICLDNELIPPYWQQQFASLRSLLESSVPTGRNRLSGHGQGTTPIRIPGHIVSYMLHMTASAIVFLLEAEDSL